MGDVAKRLVLVILLQGFVGLATQNAEPSQRESVLDRPVLGNHLKYLTTMDAFSLAVSAVNAPGGFVKLSTCEPDLVQQTWKPVGIPLRQVLDGIITADPRYRWEAIDGSINMLPAKQEPPLLRARIGEFRIENVTSARDALNQLVRMPEVGQAMADLHLKPGVAIIVSPSSPRPRAFDVICKNVSLREALNAIARAQGRAVWDYVERHCGEEHQVTIRISG